MPDPLHTAYNAEFAKRARAIHDSLPTEQQKQHQPHLDRFLGLDHFAILKRQAKGDVDTASDVAAHLLYGTDGQSQGTLFTKYNPHLGNLDTRFLLSGKMVTRKRTHFDESTLSETADRLSGEAGRKLTEGDVAKRSYLEAAPDSAYKRQKTLHSAREAFAKRQNALPDEHHAANFEKKIASVGDEGIQPSYFSNAYKLPRERVEAILSQMEKEGRIVSKQHRTQRRHGIAVVTKWHPPTHADLVTDPHFGDIYDPAKLAEASKLLKSGQDPDQIARQFGYKSRRTARGFLTRAKKMQRTEYPDRYATLPPDLYEQYQYAYGDEYPESPPSRTKPQSRLQNEVDAVPPKAKPRYDGGDVYTPTVDDFENEKVLGENSGEKMPVDKWRDYPSSLPPRPEPQTDSSKRDASRLTGEDIAEPLRGTRLAWQLMQIAKDHRGSEIAVLARKALRGKVPKGVDPFAEIGKMLKDVGDYRAAAYNWHRVNEGVAIDQAVKKYVASLRLRDPATEDQRFSIAAKTFGLQGKSLDEAAAHQQQFFKKLRTFVKQQLAAEHPKLDLSSDKLDRALRRLAYHEQDTREIGQGPRTRQQKVSIVEGHDAVGRSVPGTVKPVASTEHPWRDYMSLLPGYGGGGGESSAERYARKPGSTTGNEPPPSGLTPTNVETLSKKQRFLAALRQAKRRLARSSEPPEKLLPAVEDTLTKRGTLSHTELARYTAMHGDKLTEVVDHGVKTGRLEVETRRPESGHGPDGRYVSLVKRLSRNDIAVKYAKVSHQDLTAMLNGVHSSGSEQHLPSLVLADYFDDHNMPGHAEFIRKSIDSTDAYIARDREGTPDAELDEILKPRYFYTMENLNPAGREGVLSMRAYPTRHQPAQMFLDFDDADSRTPLRKRIIYHIFGEDGQHNDLLQQVKAEKDANELHGRKPQRYAAYKAPAGGMTYKGVYYNGGQLVPDVSKVQSTPNETPKPFTPRLPSNSTPIDKSKFLSLLKSKIKSK